MKIRKTYKFRVRPSRRQETLLVAFAGARRFIWNWGLARRKENYAAKSKTLSYIDQASELVKLKREEKTSWLKEAPSHVLQQALIDLDRAYAAFFRKGPSGSRLPRFKSKKTDLLNFRIPGDFRIENERIVAPKLGPLRVYGFRPIEGTPKSLVFKRTRTGKWFVSVLAECEIPDSKPPVAVDDFVGIDFGFENFLILSSGELVCSPRFYRKAERRLAKAYRKLSRRNIGSGRRAKAKFELSRLHESISNKRKDFIHKTTTEIVQKYSGVGIENLHVKSLARTKLAKSVMDSALGEARRQFAYKCEWSLKPCVVVDRWFPSSKKCSTCGLVNKTLKLFDRVWTCQCGETHRRDPNSAKNLRDEGLRILAGGQPDSLNDWGVCVRPEFSGGER